MKKVKIVHVEDRFHPDMGYQLNFTAKFHGPEVDMHIVTSDSVKLWEGNSFNPSDIEEKDRTFEHKHHIQIHRLPVLFEKNKGYNLILKGLIKKIYELNPDVLFIHAMESYTAFSLLRRKRVFNDFLICCDTHTLKNQFSNSLIERFYFFLFKKFAISNIRKNKSLTFYTAAENQEILLHQYGLRPEQTHPYLIGTDSQIFHPDKKAGQYLRESLKISENHNVILYAGKFNHAKQPHLLLDALDNEPSNHQNLTVVMIGGKHENYYKEHFSKRSKSIKYKTVILEAVKSHELNSYYNLADIVVFPRENTLSALDSQLCSTPVIMEEDATNTERLSKGGLCYKPNDLTDLGLKITILLNDPALRLKLGQEGRDYILSKYAYRNIIRTMENTIFEHL